MNFGYHPKKVILIALLINALIINIKIKAK